jgi:integrase
MKELQICKAGPLSREEAIKAGTGLLPERFPFLIEKCTGAVVHEGTLFLAKLCLGGGSTEYFIVTPATAMSRAYDLRDFLNFLESRKLELAEVSADNLYSYAATMANRVSTQTREIYSPTTIARRVSVAVKFCVWLCRRGTIRSPAASRITSLGSDLGYGAYGQSISRSHGRKSIRPTLLPTAQRQHEPYILSELQARTLLTAVESRVGQETGARTKALRKRDVLMCKLSLCGGLRREEVCSLSQAAVMGIVPEASGMRLYPVILTKTKNDVRRKVLLPGSLIREIQSFMTNERTQLCDGKCRGGCGMSSPIFPSSRPSNKGRCRAMTPQNYGLTVRRAAGIAGIVRRATKLDTKGGEVATLLLPAVSTHDLRHTYAVWTYLLLRSKGDTNPWLFVQAQLGHRSQETTINVYLRAVRMFENEISEVLVEFVRGLTAMLRGSESDHTRAD